MPPNPNNPQVLGLSPDDASTFRKMADWFRQRFIDRPVRVPEEPLDNGPWTAVVLTPVGGIGPMWNTVLHYTGTGTYQNHVTGTGTGTAFGDDGDRPGFAECDEYALEHATPGNPGRPLVRPRLYPTGMTLTVYNLSNQEINGNQFVTVHRDRWGDWYVPWFGLLFEEC